MVHPVDVAPFRSGSPGERLDVAARIDAACRDSGFLVVTGHGVAPERCDAVLDAFGAFFDEPLAEKRRWIVADEAANRGYSELGKEALAYSRGETTPPDLFEAFNVGLDDLSDPYFDRHRAFFAPNVWPDVPAELHDTWRAYESGANTLAETLLRAMALALDLPELWFVDRCHHAIVTTRAINYERSPGSPDPAPDQMRMGAHTDYGILTILLADAVPGLQVFRDGVWHDVVPARLVRVQHRRHAPALDERPVDVDAAPRRTAARKRRRPGAEARHRTLPRLRARSRRGMHPDVHGPGEPAALRARHGRRVAAREGARGRARQLPDLDGTRVTTRS